MFEEIKQRLLKTGKTVIHYFEWIYVWTTAFSQVVQKH